MRLGAIDQGTTSTRMVVADAQGVRVVASRLHATRHPRPGWVEQDPAELLANIVASIDAAGPLDALGLANQGESCLAWETKTGEPLSPVIGWQDSRTAAWLAALPAETRQRMTDLSGLPADAYFSAAKLGWIMRHVPAAQQALRAGRLRLGTTDAFFLDRLAGCFATDRATAGRTALVNRHTGTWDAELCDLFGVPIDCLPPIRPNVGDFGAIAGVPVRAAIVDQQAALYGHGCRHPGEAKITFGTGGFALALTGGPVAPEAAHGLLPTIAWDVGHGARHALDGGIYDVGSALDWAIRAGLAESVADFARFEGPSALERGLVFVPAFSGLAAPDWDRSAAPLIIGLTPAMTRTDLCQALLEGIALAAAGVLDAMAQIVSLTGPVSIDGGVARSAYFGQFLANCLGREVIVRGFDERTALGVLMLVGTAVGVEVAGVADTDRCVRPRDPISDVARQRHAEAQRRSRGWR